MLLIYMLYNSGGYMVIFFVSIDEKEIQQKHCCVQ